MLCGILDGRAAWGEMDTCMCVAELLCCETITALLIGYTQYKIKSLKKNKFTFFLKKKNVCLIPSK
jgi:hypothetical protein